MMHLIARWKLVIPSSKSQSNPVASLAAEPFPSNFNNFLTHISFCVCYLTSPVLRRGDPPWEQKLNFAGRNWIGVRVGKMRQRESTSEPEKRGGGGGIFNRAFTHACTLEIDLGRVPLIRRWAVIRKNQSVCRREVRNCSSGCRQPRPRARCSYSRERNNSRW